MKKLRITILLSLHLIWATMVLAQLNYDTVLVKTVGSGMVLTKINETTNPWTINVLEIDLTNPYLAFETVKANDKLVGVERTSKMALRKETTQRKVVGAINGDFYGGTGIPTNTQVVNSELLKAPNGRITFGFANEKKPFFATPAFSGKIIYHGQELLINNVNSARNDNQLIIYNSYQGISTNTNEYGTEIFCSPITNWAVNDTVWCLAKSKEENIGNMNLTSGMLVLSGHGNAASFLSSNLSINDTIGIILQLSNCPANVTQLIGGNPLLVNNGTNATNLELPSHGYDKHPRTAVGFSADSTTLYWITVDGRQTQSVGMTLYELAEFMLMVGVHQGINLDGGGSTTMVVNHKIQNAPSDASGERNVSNAFIALSTAPVGELNGIKIQPDPVRIKFGSTQTVSISAYNQYDNILEMDSTEIDWIYSENAGTFLNGSLFKANGTVKNGFLKANYHNFSDSIPIVILPVDSIWIEPKGSITDSIQPIVFIVQSKNLNSTNYQVLPEVINWSVADETIGTITENGIFTGLKNGTTDVIATVDGVTAQCEVKVQIICGTVLLDPMETPETWNINTEFMDTIKLKLNNIDFTEGSGCLEIDYQFTYIGRIPAFVISKIIDTPGMPDSAWIDMHFDNKEQRVSFRFTTQSNINVLSYSPIKTRVDWGIMGGEVIQQAINEYPLRMQHVKIEFWKNPEWVQNQVYSGTIYLDNLRVSYPGHESIMVSKKLPDHYSTELFQISPNPMAAKTNCYLTNQANTLPAHVSIISLNGKYLHHQTINTGIEVAQLKTEHLKSGIYLVHFRSAHRCETKKLIIQ